MMVYFFNAYFKISHCKDCCGVIRTSTSFLSLDANHPSPIPEVSGNQVTCFAQWDAVEGPEKAAFLSVLCHRDWVRAGCSTLDQSSLNPVSGCPGGLSATWTQESELLSCQATQVLMLLPQQNLVSPVWYCFFLVEPCSKNATNIKTTLETSFTA